MARRARHEYDNVTITGLVDVIEQYSEIKFGLRAVEEPRERASTKFDRGALRQGPTPSPIPRDEHFVRLRAS